ncbi:MAG: hypothetical protein QM723_12100 [Myxococcaceae bacterium]
MTTDGSPTSRHSYDGVAYLPSVGKLYAGGYFPWYDGGNTPNDDPRAFVPGIFDPTSISWALPGLGFGSVGLTAWDPLTGYLLVSDDNHLAAYDPVNNTYLHGSGPNWAFGESAMALDTDDRLVIAVSEGENEAFSWDLSGVDWTDAGSAIPPNQIYATFVGGDAGVPMTATAMGVDYDPQKKLFVGWGGDSTVWTLDPKTRAWSEITNVNPAPTNQSPDGIYGRWWYAPEYDVFLGYNDPDGNVWLYKMP